MFDSVPDDAVTVAVTRERHRAAGGYVDREVVDVSVAHFAGQLCTAAAAPSTSRRVSPVGIVSFTFAPCTSTGPALLATIV